MYDTALKWQLISPDTAKNKRLIRDTIRSLSDGETYWQRLQVIAYGYKMQEATLMAYVREFFDLCKKKDIPIWIVSHKTQYPNIGDANIDLRKAAMNWMESKGFFDPKDIGLRRDHVFFESTRADKIQKIKYLKVTHFIDDLEETFNEPSFPKEVEKILFAPHGQSSIITGLKTFTSWAEILEYFFDQSIILTH